MKIFAGAGEASGDRILAGLLEGLRKSVPDLEIRGFGGPLSAAQGLESLFPIDRLAVNGVGDVLRRGLFLASARARLGAELKRFRPDLVLLTDYPGMNVPLARQAVRAACPVHYVAPPQLWAYRNPEPRARRLKKNLHGVSLQVLFPFERKHYEPWASRLCQGHFFAPPASEPPRGDRLLLCPGSRSGVLRRNLPLWLDRLRNAGWPPDALDVLVPEFLAPEARGLCRGIRLLTDKHEAFARAGAAIAFPGTVTLELFLRRIPARVWAVLDPITLWAGKRTLQGPYVALPNVLAGREVFPEWTGTRGDFQHAAPAPPKHGEHRAPVESAAVETVWAGMGSGNGVEEGVRACLELIRGTGAPRS